MSFYFSDLKLSSIMLFRIVFRCLCAVLSACCCVFQVAGQLTARGFDGKEATNYAYPNGNRDTIFVFNQTPNTKKGNLSLEYRPPSDISWAVKNQETLEYEFFAECLNSKECTENLDAGEYRITVENFFEPVKTLYFTIDEGKAGPFTYKVEPVEAVFSWFFFDYDAKEFAPFKTETTIHSADEDLQQGGYKVTVTPHGELAPRDSFAAWLYMNQGFDFALYKDTDGEVLHNYKNCFHTDFRLASNTATSTFTYHNLARMEQPALTFVNKITFAMKPGNEPEVSNMTLNTWGGTQIIRDNEPPRKDTDYIFRAFDMFGIEKKDEIKYSTILPFTEVKDPVLPETDPTSAPVPVKFTSAPFEITWQNDEYTWRFGNGDSIVFNPEHPHPDTVHYIYYRPRTQTYQVTVKVTSMWGCEYVAPAVTVSVDEPSLDVGNVFTPNGDGMNDYFKPHTVSLRRFEITIYSRAGKRVYYHRGDDLREWEGWDGRIEKTGTPATQGVYFYTIKAFGWDDPSTRNPQTGPYEGFFYLYR